jgi:hypothetical protein
MEPPFQVGYMSRPAYCPHCKSLQPHRFASDEMGHVLWCQTCHYAHLPAKSEEECGDCYYWAFGQCLCADAMAAEDGEVCLYRRARRVQPEPPGNF